MSGRRRDRDPRAVPRWSVVTAAVCIAAVLLIPLGLRAYAGWPTLPGSESYDALVRISYGTDMPTPYDLLLSIAQMVNLGWLLPMAIGLAALLAFVAFLTPRFGAPLAGIAGIALAISPPLLVAGTRHSAPLLALLLFLLALLDGGRRWRQALLIALGTVLAPLPGVALAIVLSAIRGFERDRTGAIAGVFAIAAAYLWSFAWTGHALTLFGGISPSFRVLAEFGVAGGVSVFAVILAAYGAHTATRPVHAWGALLLTIVLLLLIPTFALFASLLISLLAARGVLAMVRRRWDLELLRQVLLVIIVCASIFTIITTVRDIAHEQPSDRLVSVLTYIGEQRRPGGVLTDPSLSSMVIYYSGRSPALSSDASQEDITRSFLVRDAQETYDLLERTDTSFVLITKEMRHGLFTRSDEGMLFLLPNTERFVAITVDDSVSLWYYIRRSGQHSLTP